MLFCYILSGWEGSAADGGVYHDAWVNDWSIPEGKYYPKMQVIPSVMHCWCHFGESTIISESGRNLAYSEGSHGFTLELPHTDYQGLFSFKAISSDPSLCH